jgi:hypothetical protein
MTQHKRYRRRCVIEDPFAKIREETIHLRRTKEHTRQQEEQRQAIEAEKAEVLAALEATK